MHYGPPQFIILDLFTSDRVYLSGCLAAFNFEELNVFLLTEKLLVYIQFLYILYVCVCVCVCVCIYIYIYISIQEPLGIFSRVCLNNTFHCSLLHSRLHKLLVAA